MYTPKGLPQITATPVVAQKYAEVRQLLDCANNDLRDLQKERVGIADGDRSAKIRNTRAQNEVEAVIEQYQEIKRQYEEQYGLAAPFSAEVWMPRQISPINEKIAKAQAELEQAIREVAENPTSVRTFEWRSRDIAHNQVVINLWTRVLNIMTDDNYTLVEKYEALVELRSNLMDEALRFDPTSRSSNLMTNAMTDIAHQLKSQFVRWDLGSYIAQIEVAYRCIRTSELMEVE